MLFKTSLVSSPPCLHGRVSCTLPSRCSSLQPRYSSSSLSRHTSINASPTYPSVYPSTCHSRTTHTPSHVACHAKRKRPSSDSGGDGGILSNIDALFAREPERQVNGERRDAAKRGFGAGNNRASFATYSKPRKLTLLEALDEVEAAAAPSAKHTVDLLYSLGSALREGDDGGRRLSTSMQQRLVRAVTKLAGLMLQSSSSSNSSNQPIEQLGGKELSLSAWALGKVKLMQGSELSIRLGSALASRALTNTSMDGQGAKGWLNWANLLYGLAEAGLKCSSMRPAF